MYKICSLCQIEKLIEYFSFRDKKNNIRRNQCRECNNKKSKEFYYKDTQRYVDKRKIYAQNNIENIRSYVRKSYKKHKEKRLKESRKYKKNNREKICKSNNANRAKIYKFIEQVYKSNIPCYYCNIIYDPICMDFDHIDATQKIATVSKLINNGRALSVIVEEINKCVLCCANCHADKTFLERHPDGRYAESKDIRININRNIINELKSNPCIDCGKKFKSWQLDYDHIGNNKIDGISRLVTFGYSLNTILNEIDKCELRCKNCHRLKTQVRRK